MEIWDELKCPECGGERFQLGPRGGCSINIRCVCGRRLNVCHLPDGRWWVEDIDAPKYIEAKANIVQLIKSIPQRIPRRKYERLE